MNIKIKACSNRYYIVTKYEYLERFRIYFDYVFTLTMSNRLIRLL